MTYITDPAERTLLCPLCGEAYSPRFGHYCSGRAGMQYCSICRTWYILTTAVHVCLPQPSRTYSEPSITYCPSPTLWSAQDWRAIAEKLAEALARIADGSSIDAERAAEDALNAAGWSIEDNGWVVLGKARAAGLLEVKG